MCVFFFCPCSMCVCVWCWTAVRPANLVELAGLDKVAHKLSVLGGDFRLAHNLGLVLALLAPGGRGTELAAGDSEHRQAARGCGSRAGRSGRADRRAGHAPERTQSRCHLDIRVRSRWVEENSLGDDGRGHQHHKGGLQRQTCTCSVGGAWLREGGGGGGVAVVAVVTEVRQAAAAARVF